MENEYTAKKGSAALNVIGWISAVMALFWYPAVFGVLGVIMGILSAKRHNRAGVTLIAFSMIMMGIGLFYSGVILNYTKHYLGFY